MLVTCTCDAGVKVVYGLQRVNTIHPIALVHMRPENTHKHIGYYTIVHGFCFFKLFPLGCIELTMNCL